MNMSGFLQHLISTCKHDIHNLPAYINANMEVRGSCHDVRCSRSRDLEGAHEHDGIWKRPRVEERAHPDHSTKLWAVFVCLPFSNPINLLGGIDGKQSILRVYDTILHRECAQQREGTNRLSHSGPSICVCSTNLWMHQRQRTRENAAVVATSGP